MPFPSVEAMSAALVIDDHRPALKLPSNSESTPLGSTGLEHARSIVVPDPMRSDMDLIKTSEARKLGFNLHVMSPSRISESTDGNGIAAIATKYTRQQHSHGCIA
jgi:hypothetical protein